ncbi:MAG: CPBP family intramembrane metalloprotease [Chloroflexaceae bacterium]|nr:CPBP family intramembrane metalloprotease [Chloroflexaceae bacterium]
MERTRAIIEVVLIFGLTLSLMVLVSLSAFGRWERGLTDRPFIEYGIMMAVPTLFLVARRRRLPAYGLAFRPLAYHLKIAAIASAPVALAGAASVWVDGREWPGALVLAVAHIVVLFGLGWLLRRQPTGLEQGIALPALTLIVASEQAAGGGAGRALSGFVFYLLFLGPGEELLFRGYIQSTLNAAFGRPFRFFGVAWGWGGAIAAVLFGVMHVLNLGGLVSGAWALQWWWGMWTLVAGLVLGFIREKSGSIIAPAIAHGLPQALAAVIG